MLGWWILIVTQKNQSLASWHTSLGGTDWLDELVNQGKAKLLCANGYPNRYAAKAGDILPILLAGVPKNKSPEVIGEDYIIPANWSGRQKLDKKVAARCKPSDLLIIEAWDQS